MVEAKYFKDYNHNYLILKCEETGIGENYQHRMLSSNKIDRILKCYVRNINGAVYFYYDISSKITLENFCQGKKLSYEQVRDFFIQMNGVYQSIGEFFMEESGLLLYPNCIYYDFTSKKYFGLYYPQEAEETEGIGKSETRGNMENGYEELLDFLLNHIDNGNQKLVDIIYQIYDMAEGTFFSLADALLLFEEYEDREESILTAGKMVEPMQIPAGAGEDKGSDGIENYYSFMDEEESDMESAAEKEKKQKKSTQNEFRQKSGGMFYPVFAVASVIGIGVMGWVYFYYELTEQEFMTVACCAAVMGLCFLFSLAQMLLSGHKNKKSQEQERELLQDIEDEFREERGIVIEDVLDKNMGMTLAGNNRAGQESEYGGASRKNRKKKEMNWYLEENKERYGQTIFLEAGKQNIEYKLYALDKKNKKHIHLTQFPFTIGKMPGCVDCVLTDDSISRLHARIEKQDEKILLTDMNSMNGTYKNGLRMEPSETVEIEPGDEIRFGKLNYCYR